MTLVSGLNVATVIDMKRVICGIAILMAATVIPRPAEAAPGGYMIWPPSMANSDGAISDSGLIELPNAGAPKFVFRVYLPPDYKPDTTVRARVRLNLLNLCTAKLSLTFTRRTRIGAVDRVSTAGIAPVGGLTVTATGFVSVSKTFAISGLTGGTIKGQKPGDMILLNIARDAGSTDDNCPGSLLLEGVEVIYTKQ